MKTKEEILKKYLNDVMFRHYPSSIKLIEGAMEEYAQQQVKNNAVLPLVSDTVCPACYGAGVVPGDINGCYHCAGTGKQTGR